MVQFLSLLTQAIERGNIELAVVFNGTIEGCRMNEWIAEQANIRQKVGMVCITHLTLAKIYKCIFVIFYDCFIIVK